MYHTEKDPIHRVNYKTDKVVIPRGEKQRRLHKAFLRYHDPDNWPMIREALQKMGKAHLIGYGKKHLVPPTQPANHPTGQKQAESAARKPGAASRQPRKGQILTQHTGLPPRAGNSAKKTGSPVSAHGEQSHAGSKRESARPDNRRSGAAKPAASRTAPGARKGPGGNKRGR